MDRGILPDHSVQEQRSGVSITTINRGSVEEVNDPAPLVNKQGTRFNTTIAQGIL